MDSGSARIESEAFRGNALERHRRFAQCGPRMAAGIAGEIPDRSTVPGDSSLFSRCAQALGGSRTRGSTSEAPWKDRGTRRPVARAAMPSRAESTNPAERDSIPSWLEFGPILRLRGGNLAEGDDYSPIKGSKRGKDRCDREDPPRRSAIVDLPARKWSDPARIMLGPRSTRKLP
ncbi:hypothetical protein KM043_000597 [Ampulex compressa]|nr:hypothetical protein KM043_000597 [Ampulex compressa]